MAPLTPEEIADGLAATAKAEEIKATALVVAAALKLNGVDSIRKNWPVLLTFFALVGQWFAMGAKVDTANAKVEVLTIQGDKTQTKIDNLSEAFFKMQGAFEASSKPK